MARGVAVTAVEVGCLLACACVCLGLDVSALGPSGVRSRCLCEGVCGFEIEGVKVCVSSEILSFSKKARVLAFA